MPQMLGLQPVKFDARTLLLRDYVSKLAPIPDSADWTPKAGPFPILLNDRIGDCAVAGSLHQNKAWILNEGGSYSPTDAMALADYEAVGHYNPADPNSDQGCILLDVMNYWRQTGLGNNRIGAFASVNPQDDHACCFSINEFGGLQLGIQLPAALQGAPPGTPWTYPGSVRGAWRPGSWGGHRIVLLGFNRTTGKYKGVSWGQVLDMDFDFVATYADPHVGGESYAAVSAAFLNANLVTPGGTPLTQLLSDLGQITAA